MSTLYASFGTLDSAQKAVGALLDHGAKPEDVSLVANQPNGSFHAEEASAVAGDAESTAKHGITTTTGGDAVIGAAKGAMVGVGIGILAALAAIAIPGVGLVVGGGALATAIAGAAGATAAGAAAGGITGFLEDQGMGPEVVTRYSTAFAEGSTIVAVAVPTGSLLPENAEQLLAKYGAAEIATYNGSRVLMDRETPKQPLTINNSNFDPIEILPSSSAPQTLDMTTVESHADVVEPGMPPIVATNPPSYFIDRVPADVHSRAVIRPLVTNPITGVIEQAVLIDPLTGFERTIRYEDGVPVYLDPNVSEHPVVNEASDTVINREDPTRPTVTLTGSDRVTIL
jgi:hypothetical protein